MASAMGEEEVAAALVCFYEQVEPEKAKPEKVRKVMAQFEAKAKKTPGVDWRELMFGKLAEKYSKDPRAVSQEQLDAKTGPEPEPEPEPEGGAALRLSAAETPKSLRASATPPGSPRPKTPRGSEADDSDKMRVCLRVRPLKLADGAEARPVRERLRARGLLLRAARARG